MSPRDREWIASLVGAVLIVVFAAVVVGWTIPLLIGAFSFGWLKAVVFVLWGTICLYGVCLCAAGGRDDKQLDELAVRRSLHPHTGQVENRVPLYSREDHVA